MKVGGYYRARVVAVVRCVAGVGLENKSKTIFEYVVQIKSSNNLWTVEIIMIGHEIKTNISA